MFGECIELWLLRINMKPDVWRMYFVVVTKDKHEARCLENVLDCGY